MRIENSAPMVIVWYHEALHAKFMFKILFFFVLLMGKIPLVRQEFLSHVETSDFLIKYARKSYTLCCIIMVSSLVLGVPFLFEPSHDKTNNVAVRPAKTQISLDIRPF